MIDAKTLLLALHDALGPVVVRLELVPVRPEGYEGPLQREHLQLVVGFPCGDRPVRAYPIGPEDGSEREIAQRIAAAMRGAYPS